MSNKLQSFHTLIIGPHHGKNVHMTIKPGLVQVSDLGLNFGEFNFSVCDPFANLRENKNLAKITTYTV